MASAQPLSRGYSGRLPPEDAAKITRRITTLTVVIGLALAVGKALVWNQTHSVGILSSLAHSALDLFGAISTFLAVRYAATPPDETYRFGRGKAESFSAVFQVCLIIFAAVHLLEESFERLTAPEAVTQVGLGVAAMVIFIGLTLWLLIAQTWAIRATGSVAIKGDRAHYLADMLGSFVVILGLLLSTRPGLLRADAIVGGLIALWLLWTAYKVARLAWGQLLDRELPDSQRHHLKNLALAHPQVRAVRDLRTRASGPHVHIQMRLDLDDRLTLQAAHDIVLETEKRIMAEYKAADILIHPHPAGCDHSHGNARFKPESP